MAGQPAGRTNLGYASAIISETIRATVTESGMMPDDSSNIDLNFYANFCDLDLCSRSQ